MDAASTSRLRTISIFFIGLSPFTLDYPISLFSHEIIRCSSFFALTSESPELRRTACAGPPSTFLPFVTKEPAPVGRCTGIPTTVRINILASAMRVKGHCGQPRRGRSAAPLSLSQRPLQPSATGPSPTPTKGAARRAAPTDSRLENDEGLVQGLHLAPGQVFVADDRIAERPEARSRSAGCSCHPSEPGRNLDTDDGHIAGTGREADGTGMPLTRSRGGARGSRTSPGGQHDRPWPHRDGG